MSNGKPLQLTFKDVLVLQLPNVLRVLNQTRYDHGYVLWQCGECICAKVSYVDTSSNEWIQLFQPHSLLTGA